MTWMRPSESVGAANFSINTYSETFTQLELLSPSNIYCIFCYYATQALWRRGRLRRGVARTRHRCRFGHEARSRRTSGQGRNLPFDGGRVVARGVTSDREGRDGPTSPLACSSPGTEASC